MLRPMLLVTVCLGLGLAAAAQDALGVLEALTRPLDFTTKRESSAQPDLARNGDALPIPIGETLVLGDLEGPGVITQLWSTVGSQDPMYPRNLVLRIYYDGNEHPSVEVPLGDFFASGHGTMVDVNSIPISTTSYGRSRNSYFHMPFRERAKVTVTNESDTYRCGSFYYYLNWKQVPDLPEDTPYFHAHYRQEFPAQPGDYTILETAGRGHYVGTVLSVHQMEFGWFGEGDDRFYIDGEDYPSLSGTGTEDYFNDAWGFRPFNRPQFGVSIFEGYAPGDRVTAYRWHLTDPITFNESLRVDIEHHGSLFTSTMEFLGQFFERDDWVSSVAYWYQYPPVQFEERIPPAPERIAPYRFFLPAEMEIVGVPQMAVQRQENGIVGFMGGRDGNTVEFHFEIEEEGWYQVSALMQHQILGGVFQASINDVPVGGPRDFHDIGEGILWENFDLFRFQPGTQVLRFECLGSSPNKRAVLPHMNALVMNRFILLRLEDMEGFKAASTRVRAEQAAAAAAEAAATDAFGDPLETPDETE